MKKTVALIISFLIIISILIFLASSSKSKNPQPSGVPIPQSSLKKTDINIDYSSIYKTVPGKSTIQEVLKINGEPIKKEEKNNKTYLYYGTPGSTVFNVVVFEKNIEAYAVENIFGNYRGYFSTFQKAYGESETLLFNKMDDPLVWHIFLKKGIGVETDGKDIMKIVYFVPGDESRFLESVGTDFGIVKEKTIHF